MAFSVAWDSYQNNICHGLSLLQQKGQFVDMTLAADGHHVKVHQMVLSLVSPYISALISSAACPHPVIFLNQVSYQTLQSILQYAYTGEVMVARDKISDFLKACKALHIKGVEDLNTTTTEFHDTDDNYLEPVINTDPGTKLQQRGVIKNPPFTEQNEVTASDNDLDSPLDQDLSPYHCGGDSSGTVKDISTNKTLTENLQYTVSLKGGLQLVCNRYLYFLMSSRKSGERMWRCMTYKKKCSCRAFIVTKNNKVIKRVGAHTHAFHDSQILKRMTSGNMFSALNEVENHVESMKNQPTTSTSEPTSNLASVIRTHDKNSDHNNMPLMS